MSEKVKVTVVGSGYVGMSLPYSVIAPIPRRLLKAEIVDSDRKILLR